VMHACKTCGFFVDTEQSRVSHCEHHASCMHSISYKNRYDEENIAKGLHHAIRQALLLLFAFEHVDEIDLERGRERVAVTQLLFSAFRAEFEDRCLAVCKDCHQTILILKNVVSENAMDLFRNSFYRCFALFHWMPRYNHLNEYLQFCCCMLGKHLSQWFVHGADILNLKVGGLNLLPCPSGHCYMCNLCFLRNHCEPMEGGVEVLSAENCYFNRT